MRSTHCLPASPLEWTRPQATVVSLSATAESACADLAVLKTFLARPKDGVDLATMAATGSINLDALEESVRRLLGSEDRAGFLRRVREDLERIQRPL